MRIKNFTICCSMLLALFCSISLFSEDKAIKKDKSFIGTLLSSETEEKPKSIKKQDSDWSLSSMFGSLWDSAFGDSVADMCKKGKTRSEIKAEMKFQRIKVTKSRRILKRKYK